MQHVNWPANHIHHLLIVHRVDVVAHINCTFNIPQWRRRRCRHNPLGHHNWGRRHRYVLLCPLGPLHATRGSTRTSPSVIAGDTLREPLRRPRWRRHPPRRVTTCWFRRWCADPFLASLPTDTHNSSGNKLPKKTTSNEAGA